MQRLLCAVLFITCFASAEFAQTEKQTETAVGFELDAFPFINSGYYGSAWLGIDHLRLRGVIAKTTVPSFVVEDGFSDLKTTAYAFIADYFFKENYEGWWIGAGAEYWDNSIKNSDNKASAGFSNVQFTLGGGYVWKIWRNLYINPWGALHLRAAGDAEMNVGGKNYENALLLPEASVKIGWHF
ncbi:MAG TPA: hypothetical protein VHP30_13025 [Ignavibacteriales bacterium]|nr:hypothetical protein [Ignavibacteriales bacterium]